MSGAVTRFLEARSPRERVLLAALAGIGAPLAFALLVALPLIDARTAARADLAEAEALQAWYLSRQAEIAALPVGADAVPVAGLGGIETALAGAGLRDGLERLAPTPTGGVEAAFSDVALAPLMSWADGGLAPLGYRLVSLTLVRAGEGRAGALLRIEPLR